MTDTIAEQLQTSPVEAAAQLIHTLSLKRASVEEKLAANIEARRRLSFGALAEGDAKSAKRLADLGDEHSKLERQRTDLIAAIQEGERRHQRAIADEAQAGERERAIEVDKLFEDLVKVYRAADHALAVWAECILAAADAHKAIRQAGCNHINSRSPFDLERRALSTVLQQSQLWRGNFQHEAMHIHSKVPSLAAVAESWHAAVRRPGSGWIAVRLGETAPAEAAE